MPRLALRESGQDHTLNTKPKKCRGIASSTLFGARAKTRIASLDKGSPSRERLEPFAIFFQSGLYRRLRSSTGSCSEQEIRLRGLVGFTTDREF